MSSVIINSARFSSPPAALFLDTFTGAWGAWSIYRKLRAAYAGAAIRVRRSSDNTEQDIGFSGNFLDTSALTTFVGANDGFVVKGYDQTTNARDIIQTGDTTKQPKIVSAGSILIGSTGLPMALFDGSNDWMKNASADTGLTQPITRYEVIEIDSWVSTRSVADGFTINSALDYMYDSSGRLTQFAGVGNNTNTIDTFTEDVTVLVTSKFDAANSIIRKNKNTRMTPANPGASPPQGFSVGARGDGSSPGAMRFGEAAIFPSVHSNATQDSVADHIIAGWSIV